MKTINQEKDRYICYISSNIEMSLYQKVDGGSQKDVGAYGLLMIRCQDACSTIEYIPAELTEEVFRLSIGEGLLRYLK
jgi:hypothetical protein